AIALGTTAAIEKLEPRRGVSWHLARRRAVKSYDRYLKARGLEAREWPRAHDAGLSATIHFRDRDEDLSFCARRCRRCGAVQFPGGEGDLALWGERCRRWGAVQFPMQRVCETCFAKDDFERLRLSDRSGKVVTYTFDYFFPTPDPPTVVTITEVEGARIHLQLVNTSPEDVKREMPVEFLFRRIHEPGGRPNYYWKAAPLEAER